MIDLLKQQGAIRIASEGVAAKLPLAPALILFGPNDAGKSNTLRAITALLEGAVFRPRDTLLSDLDADHDPEGGWDAIVLDLDLERLDHRELLLAVSAGGESEPRSVDVGYSSGDDLPSIPVVPEDGETSVTPDGFVNALRSFFVSWAGERSGDGADRSPEVLVDEWLRSARLDVGPDIVMVRFDQTREGEACGLPSFLWLSSGGSGVVSGLVDVVVSDLVDRDASVLLSDLGQEILRRTGRELEDDGTWMECDPPVEGQSFRPGKFRRTDPWLDVTTGLPSEEIASECGELSVLATEVAPAFVTRDYRIELQPLAPAWWHRNGDMRLRVALVPRSLDLGGPPWKLDASNEVAPPGFGIDAVGAGLRIWAVFAVYEALRRSRRTGDQARLFLFDEPERHLHPVAQREAAAFIASIVGDGGNVIVATHSTAFLNQPIPNAQYVRIHRENGITRATPFGPGKLTAIEANAAKLGLSRADLIQLTRGVLLVEGQQDKIVVDGFFGTQLADAHIRVQQIRGTDNALSLVDADLLQQLGIPVFLMLDHTSRTVVDDLSRRRITPGEPTKEDRVLGALSVALRGKEFAVTFLPFSLPDIVWALPEKAVKKIAPRFPGWEEAATALRKHTGAINPKTLLEQAYGLKVDSRTVREIVAVAREHDLEPASELKSAIASLVTQVEAQASTPP